MKLNKPGETDKADLTSDEQDCAVLSAIAQQNSRQAMSIFYHSYRNRLGAFLYRVMGRQSLVEEVFNEVMLTVWQKANQFNGNSKVSTWVFSIAYRRCLHQLRQENKHPIGDPSEPELLLATPVEDERQDIVRKALAMLSFEHRSVIELAYFVGNNYAEIGEITDCPESTVKTRMFYARQRLQQALKTIGITSAM